MRTYYLCWTTIDGREGMLKRSDLETIMAYAKILTKIRNLIRNVELKVTDQVPLNHEEENALQVLRDSLH